MEGKIALLYKGRVDNVLYFYCFVQNCSAFATITMEKMRDNNETLEEADWSRYSALRALLPRTEYLQELAKFNFLLVDVYTGHSVDMDNHAASKMPFPRLSARYLKLVDRQTRKYFEDRYHNTCNGFYLLIIADGVLDSSTMLRNLRKDAGVAGTVSNTHSKYWVKPLYEYTGILLVLQTNTTLQVTMNRSRIYNRVKRQPCYIEGGDLAKLFAMFEHEKRNHHYSKNYTGNFVFFKAGGWEVESSYDPFGLLLTDTGEIRDVFSRSVRKWDFILVLSTPAQRQMFARHANKCVSVIFENWTFDYCFTFEFCTSGGDGCNASHYAVHQSPV